MNALSAISKPPCKAWLFYCTLSELIRELLAKKKSSTFSAATDVWQETPYLLHLGF